MSNPEIIYEDDEVLALNKRAGTMVHSDGRTKEETLVDWLLAYNPNIKEVGEPIDLEGGSRIERPGIVHRLDRDTSGVIVIAKTNDAHRLLKEQFQKRTIKKVYNAFVYGIPKEKSGAVDFPIGKSSRDFRLFTTGESARGAVREAVTEYRVVGSGAEASFLEVLPKTGRTHQIRVHLKALGHPVVCDKRYAPKRLCILGFDRLALHARMLTLTTPSGTGLLLEAPLPSDFEAGLRDLRLHEES